MTNRVLLSAAGLRISKAGNDVLSTTDPQGLVFDSAAVGLNVYLTGTVSVPEATDISGNTVEVAFGETLSYYPLAFVQDLRGPYLAGGYWEEWHVVAKTGSVRRTVNGLVVRAAKDRIYITNRNLDRVSGGDTTARYVVFRGRQS